MSDTQITRYPSIIVFPGSRAVSPLHSRVWRRLPGRAIFQSRTLIFRSEQIDPYIFRVLMQNFNLICHDMWTLCNNFSLKVLPPPPVQQWRHLGSMHWTLAPSQYSFDFSPTFVPKVAQHRKYTVEDASLTRIWNLGITAWYPSGENRRTSTWDNTKRLLKRAHIKTLGPTIRPCHQRAHLPRNCTSTP